MPDTQIKAGFFWFYVHNFPQKKLQGFQSMVFRQFPSLAPMEVLELPVLPVEDVYLPGAPVTLQASNLSIFQG